jgi:RNA polymerase sigma factor (sigma-70 family)
MMTTRAMSVAIPNDAELVGESLSGNRHAFGQIVARYQSLVCSLAYSATGSLSQSEDLAQETFVTAWKQLAGLREPEKLRAWLCRIARNLAYDTIRKQGREPSHAAELLETAHESPSPEPSPTERAISNEEREILWRSLEKIPEIYREPFILFYREHQSIEAVAQNLELTEDAVKQRLSRGRKLLHEQVLAFVEGALEKTSPGNFFTVAVIAALPLLATSTKAATVGAVIVKGATVSGSTMKTMTALKITTFAAVLTNAVISQEIVATHFDWAGRPNGWMTHSHYLLFSLIVGCGLPMSLAVFGYFLRFLPINRFTFKIPNRDYWLAPERRNEMFNYLFRHCLWLACLMAIFMVGIQLLVIQANHQTPPHLSISLTLAAAVGFLAAKVVWIGTLFCHFKKVAD